MCTYTLNKTLTNIYFRVGWFLIFKEILTCHSCIGLVKEVEDYFRKEKKISKKPL